MGEVRVDVDAGGAKWLGFAKKKLVQLKQWARDTGVEFHQRALVVDGTQLYMSTGYSSDKIRITGGASFFRLYGRTEALPDFSQIWNHNSLLGISDAGQKAWRYDFTTHDVVATGTIARTLLGCSSDGQTVLLLEVVPDVSLTVRVFRDGRLSSSPSFVLTTQDVIGGYSWLGGGTFKVFVSADGTRALIQGGRYRIDVATATTAWFYYGKDLVPQIQPLTIPISAISISAVSTCGGSIDLATVWLANERWEQPLVGTAPPIEIRKVEYLLGDDDTAPSLQATSMEIPTPSGGSHAVVANHFAFAPDGSYVVAYNVVTPGNFIGTVLNTVDSRVHDSLGEDYSVRFTSSEGYDSVADASYQYTISSLTRDARAFVLLDQGYDLLDTDYGVVADQIKTAFVASETPIGVSSDTENVVVRLASKHITRRGGVDYDFVDSTGDTTTRSYINTDASVVLLGSRFPLVDFTISKWTEQLNAALERTGYTTGGVMGNFTGTVLSPSAITPDTTVNLTASQGVTRHTQVFLAAG